MVIPAWAALLLGVMTFLIGGGTVGKYLAAMLRRGAESEQENRLKLKFATTDELNGYRKSVDAALELIAKDVAQAVRQSDMAIIASEKAVSDIKDQSGRLEMYHTQLMREALGPIKDMQTEIKEMGKNMSAQTALLTRMMSEIDRRRE